MAYFAGGCHNRLRKPAAPVDTATADANAVPQAPAVVDRSGCLNPPTNMEGPDGAVFQFLAAIRSGDDAKTEAMFSDLARTKIQKLQYKVTPPGSDTAQFEIGKVEFLTPEGNSSDDVAGSSGARVEATWSDLDPEGKRQAESMLWMVRKDSNGWRIAGMAATVFPNEPPVLLDFENLEEALKKLQMLQEEIARRGTPGAAVETKGESSLPTPPQAPPPAGAPSQENPPSVADKENATSLQR